MKTYTVGADAALPLTSDVSLEWQGVAHGRTYTIQDMPQHDKPREKLLQHGPSMLSLKELLAVVLSHGTRKEDVLSMADRMVRDYGEQVLTSQKNPRAIAAEMDIPENKAMQIVACAEIGRRLFAERNSGPVVIRTPQDVFDHLQDLRTLPKEHLRGLYLNTRNQVIRDEVLSIGTLSASVIHPREALRPAIEYGAAAFVLAHNHPSGELTPSDADIAVTRQIHEAGELVGIALLDHVIITQDGYQSIEHTTN